MAVELKPEHRRVIDLAIQPGAYRDSEEVIGTVLSMPIEGIDDAAVSKSLSNEPRCTLAEVEEELRALGKLK